MRTVIWRDLGGPDSLDKEVTPPSTPDPETLRIMQAQDPNAVYKVVGPSSWDLMSAEDRSATEAEAATVYQRMQQQPFNGGRTTSYSESRDPISGALYEDTRVYTRKEGEEWRFWGIPEDGMTVAEFWAKHDPENTRGEDTREEAEAEALPKAAAETHNSPSPYKGAAAKPQRSKPTPETNANHWVRKPKSPPPPVNKNTGRSSGSNKGISRKTFKEPSKVTDEAVGSQELEPSQAVDEAPHSRNKTAGKKSARKSSAPIPNSKQIGKEALPISGSDAFTSQEPYSTRNFKAEEDKAPPKRPQRHPLTNAKSNPGKKDEKKNKKTPVKGNARVTKPKEKDRPPPAPSAHFMRTRARGSAEKLSLS